MKKNFKLSFKQLLLVGIVALTGIQAPTSAYAMSNATQQIMQSEKPVKSDYQERNNFQLYINGKKQVVENNFLVVNGRTFLPLREVSNLLGASVDWDGANQVASVSKDNTLVEIPIGYTQASVNGEIKSLDSGSSSVKVDKKLPDGGAHDLERIASRRAGTAFGLRSLPAGNSRPRQRGSARNHTHDTLVRPLHGLLGASL